MGAIVISDLTKKIGRKTVLSNINLEVLEGEFFSILGVEDSGKTTLGKILFNFLKPSKGSATIFDMNVVKESKEIKEFCSYVPQEVWIYEGLKPMSIFKKTLGFHKMKSTDEMNMLVDYFNVDTKKRFIDLDENEKKKVSIVNALITKPKLLILDEPTLGLNDIMRDKLYTQLNNLKRDENLTLLLLTDALSEAQRISDRVAYLDNGEIRDIEYLTEKTTNDKIVRIYENVLDLTPFTDIGAKIINNESGNVALYYDKDLKDLTRVIYEANIGNYNIEDSNLADKMAAYYKGGVENDNI